MSRADRNDSDFLPACCFRKQVVEAERIRFSSAFVVSLRRTQKVVGAGKKTGVSGYLIKFLRETSISVGFAEKFYIVP